MFRRNYSVALAVMVLAVLAGIYLLAVRPAPTEPAATTAVAPPPPAPIPTVPAAPAIDQTTKSPPTAVTSNDTPTVKIPQKGPLRIRKGDPIPELFPFQTQRDEINRLATLPADQALLPLAEFLKHDDPIVREEARTALIRLSSPAAAPYLRAAATKAKTPEEAADLREAADFLSLVSS